MQKLLLLVAFLFCFSGVHSKSDSIGNSNRLKYLKQSPVKSKLGKTSNCFELTNPYKISTLCRLIQVGNYKGAACLIEKGADVNDMSIKLTPLMYAARHNRADIAQLLIDNGADLRIRSSRNGLTALKWAKLSKASETYDVIAKAMHPKKNKPRIY